jgi:hypothetical protein
MCPRNDIHLAIGLKAMKLADHAALEL